MKKNLFLLIIITSTAFNSFCQKTNFGFSICSINDVDWNRPLADFQLTYSAMSVLSNNPIKFGLSVEKEFKKISPSVNLNLIYRSIKFSERYTPLSNLNNFTLELPINFTFRKPIGDETSMILNVGGGVNYILPTSERQVGMFSSDSLIYSFNIVNKNKLNAFINGGIGMECSLKKYGKMQFKIDYFFQFSKQLQYQYQYNSFKQLTNSYKMNYASIGFVYYLPI